MSIAGLRFLVLALALSPLVGARADYGDECRALSAQLARDPGSLKVGDLDVMKTCLSELQRVLVVGGKTPEGVADLCPAPVVETPRCAVCPTAAQLCSRRDAETPAARESRPEPRPKQRDPSSDSDRRLKPSLPVF